MRNRKIIVWLLMAVLALAAAHFMLSWYGAGKVGIVRRTSLLNPLLQVSRIDIAGAARQPVSLSRQNLRFWRLTSPYAASVDEQVVMRLLDALAFTSIDDATTEAELLRSGRTRADYGLDDSALSVTLLAGDVPVRIVFGAATPSGDGIYAAVEGDRSVFTLTNSVLAAVDVPAAGFRRRSLFPVGVETVSSFVVKKGAAVPLSFTRDGEGWKVGDAKASAQKVRDFLDALFAARAENFVWPTGGTNEAATASEALLSGYGLDPESAVTVTLKCLDGTDRRVSFGKEAENQMVYALAQNAGAVVTVPIAIRDLATQGAIGYTDSRLFPLEEASVVSFTVSDGTTDYVVARGEGDAWRLDAPVATAADSTAVRALLGRVLSLTSDDLSESGLRVSVTSNAAPVTVSAAKVLGDLHFEDLRSREILKIDSAVVKRLVATRAGSAKPDAVVFDRERRVWKVESSEKDGAVDSSGVEKVLAVLNPLRAERIEKLKVGASDLPRYGLETPRLTISIDQDRDDAVRRNVIIGERADENLHYATVGSSDAVFLLSAETVEKLSSSLIGE